MSIQIIILSSMTQPDGSFTVSGVFWLVTPSNNITPNPKAKSLVSNIDTANLTALQNGTMVEETFTSGGFASGTSSADVQSALQTLFSTAQTALNNTNSPITGLVGTAYNGSAWATPTFVPAPAVSQPVTLFTSIGASPLTPDGRIRMAAEKSIASRTNFYSHNWCDATTWYQPSVYVASETATADGYYTVYSLAHSPVIDTYHGKITLEDQLKDSLGHSYRVTVKVDSYTKTEQDPHYGTGGDFTINYNTGKITFFTPLSSGNVVTVTYHYVHNTGDGTASRFVMTPVAGKKLTVQMAEAQFSTDVVLNDTTMFEVWGIADYFLTSGQMTALGIPAGIGYKINLQTFVYKTFNDFQNDAFRTYPTVDAIGGSNWRAQPVGMTVMDWDYIASTYLHSAQGMEIRAYLQHDVPMGGWMCTVTFYCASENEP